MTKTLDVETVVTSSYPSAYALAIGAGCSHPDSDKSPGAEFLKRVMDATIEAIQWDLDRDQLDTDEFHDQAHEIADTSVPVYTQDRWETFTDLAAYQEDVSEFGDYGSDLTQAAGVALYMIAERLILDIVSTVAEAIEDAEDDDQ